MRAARRVPCLPAISGNLRTEVCRILVRDPARARERERVSAAPQRSRWRVASGNPLEPCVDLSELQECPVGGMTLGSPLHRHDRSGGHTGLPDVGKVRAIRRPPGQRRLDRSPDGDYEARDAGTVESLVHRPHSCFANDDSVLTRCHWSEDEGPLELGFQFVHESEPGLAEEAGCLGNEVGPRDRTDRTVPARTELPPGETPIPPLGGLSLRERLWWRVPRRGSGWICRHRIHGLVRSTPRHASG